MAMQVIQVLQDAMARYWQITVILLMIGSLLADVLARKQLPWFAFLAGTLTAGGWVLLLGTKAPFARSITFNSVTSYVATVVFAIFFFGESITILQLCGLGMGAIAIMLLA